MGEKPTKAIASVGAILYMLHYILYAIIDFANKD